MTEEFKFYRRSVLSGVGAAAFISKTTHAENIKTTAHGPMTTFMRRAQDEDYWGVVRTAFDLEDGYINMRSLWSGRMPKAVEDAVVYNARAVNIQRPEYLKYKGRTYAGLKLTALKQDVARFVNAPVDEIAITQSTTEALMNVMMGLQLSSGDEIVTTDQDYQLVRGSLEQRAARDGIVIRTASLPLAPENENALVDAVMTAITPKTRAIFVCHVYYSGIVFPIRRLADRLAGRNILIGVDGALAVGHVDTDMQALGCDAYGGSFHKTGGGPRGTGFLFLREKWIPQVWPLFGDYHIFERKPVYKLDRISKFEHYGNRPDFVSAAVSEAIRFHDTVGVENRLARLQYLKRYWTDRLRGHRNIRFVTPLSENLSCSLVAFQMKNTRPGALDSHLEKEHKIMVASTMIEKLETQPVEQYSANVIWANAHLFISTDDLDRFTDAVLRVADRGLS